MQEDLVTGLLPVLGRSLDLGFNVFDVMHHGVHEKQMSNVFRWLLDAEGSHRFGSQFAVIFVTVINEQLPADERIPLGDFVVTQEVNTVQEGDGADIADIVLESAETSIVVENYLTSDGHGHGFERYLAYARRENKQGCVVLLCRDEDRSLLKQGWENAPVLTYENLVARLHGVLQGDTDYQTKNANAFAFVDQMYRKFVTRRAPMADEQVLDFINAMCSTGEAIRFQGARQEATADQFAADVAEQARIRFRESRDVLQSVKDRLRAFSRGPLLAQLNAELGESAVDKVSTTYQGIYQWTVNFDTQDPDNSIGEGKLQLKFGPSAWFANEQDSHWTAKVPQATADYSHVFITRAAHGDIRQSKVTLQEVLAGLDPTDVRLRDEILAMFG